MKAMTNLDSILISFSSIHVQMWELDHKEGWVPKNSCFWTVVLNITFESPLDCKEIKPVNPKGNQSWIFSGRTDAEFETPILWLPDVKSELTGKRLDAGGRGWDGQIASPTQWTWILAKSRRQWMTEEPGMLQSMGLKRVRHDFVTEQQQKYSRWNSASKVKSGHPLMIIYCQQQLRHNYFSDHL